MTDNIYQNKYLKYKLKYNNLKKSFENTGGKSGLWIKGKYYIICNKAILEANIEKLKIRDSGNKTITLPQFIKEENTESENNENIDQNEQNEQNTKNTKNNNHPIYQMIKEKKLRFNMNDFDNILGDNFYYWSPNYPIKKNNTKKNSFNFFKNNSICKINVNIPDFNNNNIKVDNTHTINAKDNQKGSSKIFNELFDIIVAEENKIIKQKIEYSNKLFEQLKIFNEFLNITQIEFKEIDTRCDSNNNFEKCKWIGLLVDVGTIYSNINRIYKFK